MTRHGCRRVVGVAGLGFLLFGLVGCQTWVGGMTLPSGHYLQHQPQYFAPSPTFPLDRELTTMEAEKAAAPTLPPPNPAIPPVQ